MAVDIFLKLDGVKGESKDHKHAGSIDVLSWSFGMSQTGTAHMGGGGGAGKVSVKDINFTHYLDCSSPTLWSFCTNDSHIANGLFTIRKAGEKPLEYLKIKLSDILVTHVSNGGSHGEDRMTENVSLNFAKFYMEYQEQKADGSGIPGGQMAWDIKANQKL